MNAGDVISDILGKEWFWPALAVIIGLPIVLLVLGEVHTGMVRRDSPGARIVLLIRNVLAPLAAVIILFTQIKAEDGTTLAFAFYGLKDSIDQAAAALAIDTLTTRAFECGDNLTAG